MLMPTLTFSLSLYLCLIHSSLFPPKLIIHNCFHFYWLEIKKIKKHIHIHNTHLLTHTHKLTDRHIECRQSWRYLHKSYMRWMSNGSEFVELIWFLANCNLNREAGVPWLLSRLRSTFSYWPFMDVTAGDNWSNSRVKHTEKMRERERE